MSHSPKAKILIAEDDEGHAELIRESLRDSGVSHEIIKFTDGQQTWDYMSGHLLEEASQGVPPVFLILDINMPRLNGVEVLKLIKTHPRLKRVPVFMLSTTDDSNEVEQCYNLGCNSYIVKPIDFELFSQSIRRLGWFIQIMLV